MATSRPVQQLPYLTKNAGYATFHKELNAKITQMDESKEQTKKKLAFLQKQLRELTTLDESLAGGDTMKFIAHEKSKKAVKANIEAAREKLEALTERTQRLQNHECSMRGRMIMFKGLKIDLLETEKKRKTEAKKIARSMVSLDGEKRKLGRLKAGFNMLSPEPGTKIEFEKYEKKYDLSQILQEHSNYRSAQKVKTDKIQLKFEERKKSELEMIRSRGDPSMKLSSVQSVQNSPRGYMVSSSNNSIIFKPSNNSTTSIDNKSPAPKVGTPKPTPAQAKPVGETTKPKEKIPDF